MSNETDLDWLARETEGEWFGNSTHIARDGLSDYLWANEPRLPHCRGRHRYHWFTKAQYLERKAELQNKPSWDDAPEWGEWLAQDEDGEWKWLAGLPVKYVDGWTAVKIKGCCKGSALGDWRDTLEKRPEQFKPSIEEANKLAQEFKLFTSIEDNQDQVLTQQQDNGWFERGELPPVGAVCLYVASDRRSAEVEITAHAKLGLCFVEVGKSGENYVSKTAELHRFRPIRTERDVLIEIIKNTDDTDDKIADAILAAGFSLRGK